MKGKNMSRRLKQEYLRKHKAGTRVKIKTKREYKDN
jgi:hypothetical protein